MNGEGAELVFADTGAPGITRRKCGRGWLYFSAEGTRITDPDQIRRLQSVALPPAYRDCWYSPDPRAHIQAFGHDDKGRRQYRYHPRYRAARDDHKFELLLAFGNALPLLRRRILNDIAKGDPRTQIIASVVRLIDQTSLRVGNESYARRNRSYGATTLRKRHVKVTGHNLTLRFNAKGGTATEIRLTDARLARLARRCRDLPGQRLFSFCDGDAVRDVSSTDVNQYLQGLHDTPFTAKFFRTWAGSVAAFETAAADPAAATVTRMAMAAARTLRNTPAIARSAYIHPAILAFDADALKACRRPRATRYMRAAERHMLAYLERVTGDNGMRNSISSGLQH